MTIINEAFSVKGAPLSAKTVDKFRTEQPMHANQGQNFFAICQYPVCRMNPLSNDSFVYLTLSSIYTHFNTLNTEVSGKHCGIV